MQALNSLLDLLAALRDPERGDPWHQAQDFTSIAPCTIEEAYEVADAIERHNMSDLCAELGDLLLQVIYHAQLASEQDLFTFADVVTALEQKLKTRGACDDSIFETAELSAKRWQQVKSREHLTGNGMENHSLLDQIPLSQPALSRAQKLQDRVAAAGFDWKHAGEVLEKIGEELIELQAEIQGVQVPAAIAHELGDVLFACVNLARHLHIDAEASLRLANQRFENRFHYIEERLRERNLTPAEVALDELERLWEEAKKVTMNVK